MLSVVVTIQVEPAGREAFLSALLRNAEESVANEEGCLGFDVCEDQTETGRFVLYEVYADAAAFEAHLASTHYAAYRVVADQHALPDSRQVTRCTLLSSQSGRRPLPSSEG